MHTTPTGPIDFPQLQETLRRWFEGERDFLVNTANLSAIIFHALPDLNWAGFYFYRNGELVLGPFQGKPACMRIALDRGVCGHAATTRQTTVVPDVEAFPGHIACDSASRSEIVIPLVKDGLLLGVLDIDSPVHDRFSAADAANLETCAAILVAASDTPPWLNTNNG